MSGMIIEERTFNVDTTTNKVSDTNTNKNPSMDTYILSLKRLVNNQLPISKIEELYKNKKITFEEYNFILRKDGDK